MATRTDDVGLSETPVDAVAQMVSELRDTYQRGRMSCDYRVSQLRQMELMLEENQEMILEALWRDLHKGRQEAMMTEFNPLLAELSHAITSIDHWMASKHVEKGVVNMFSSAYIQPEPYGIVLIMSPWNYPLMLSLQPLIGALAAGNSCVLKPSEISLHTSNMFNELIPLYFDKRCCQIITGGLEVSKEVLSQHYDYILYTGSAAVGRLVMRQAAEHLTPLTLELGGKSPCIVADDANIEVAARRIMWGKCVNVGQSCIAPDYIVCSRSTQERLVEAFKRTLAEFYGETPRESKHYGRIVNKRHFQRVLSLLDSVRDKVALGGDSDVSQLYISPTVLTNVDGQDGIMSEEIYGPLLPVIPLEDIEEVMKFINGRERPLALYVFTESKRILADVTERISAGGVTHNDTLLHFTVPSLPFGGVGESGFGAYHGKFSFETFSHYKPVLSAGTAAFLEGVNNVRYPPYTDAKLSDLNQIQSPGGSSLPRFFRVAYLVSKSMTGHPSHSS